MYLHDSCSGDMQHDVVIVVTYIADYKHPLNLVKLRTVATCGDHSPNYKTSFLIVAYFVVSHIEHSL